MSAVDDPIGDDVLRLIFISCHPVLSTEARAALTLRVVGGLTTDEIARAFLVPEPTIAQRIVRAKKTLGQKRIPFEVPRGLDLAARLSSVLEVIYLIFNEGYSATAGEELIRASLCEEALRLGRILAELDAREPEVHGLVALMEIQASRSRARVSATGEPILLLDQNRAVAVSMHAGPEETLRLLDPLLSEPLMKNYHLLPSVRGDLLARLSRHAEAAAEFERAASLTCNAREQTLLLERALVNAKAAARVTLS